MPMNYKDNFEMLQKQHKALEAKYKNLRGSVSYITQELRELPAEEDGWAHVSSFGIYMQLLQALMGAAPPEPEAKRFRLDAEGPRAAK